MFQKYLSLKITWSNDAENTALTTEIKYILNFTILLFFLLLYNRYF